MPRRRLGKARAEGRAGNEGWHQRKDAGRLSATGVTTALHDSGGSVHWYAKVMRDETRRNEEQERLTQAYTVECWVAATFQRALLPEIA